MHQYIGFLLAVCTQYLKIWADLYNQLSKISVCDKSMIDSSLKEIKSRIKPNISEHILTSETQIMNFYSKELWYLNISSVGSWMSFNIKYFVKYSH